uniref:HMG box domain-containing protein n=1 Tax=Plectus sambesii TaxID=2011161 RepID=A0A914XI91_9BILA
MFAIISTCRCVFLRKTINVNLRQLNLSLSRLQLCSSTFVERNCHNEPSSSTSFVESKFKKRRPYLSAFACFLKEYDSKENDNPGTPLYLWQHMTADEKSIYEAKAKAFNDLNKVTENLPQRLNVKKQKSAVNVIRSGRSEFSFNRLKNFDRKLVEEYNMPKRPLRPIWRFAAATGNRLPKSQLSVLYDRLPDEEKENYSNAYSAELTVFQEHLKEWKAKMIADGNEHILRRISGRWPKATKSSKDDWNELASQHGRPKHPGSVLTLFRSDLSAESSAMLSRQEFRRRWDQLDPEKKTEYSERLRKKTDEYRAKLRHWRESMLASGNDEIVHALSRCKTGTRANQWLPETRRSITCFKLADEHNMPKYPVGPFKKFIETLGKKMPVSEKSVLYRKLPDEQRKQYYDAFREELEAYRKNLRDWKSRMIAEGHEDVLKKLKPKGVVEQFIKTSKIEFAAEHGRPKRPKNPFARFLIDFNKARPPSEPFEFAKVAHEWNALSNDEKMKYRASYKADYGVYREQFAKWKAGMLADASEETLEKLDIRPPSRQKTTGRKKSLLSGKPKFPLYPFHRFLLDSGVTPEAEHREEQLYMWRSLKPSQKEKYQNEFRAERTVYDEKLREWKAERTAEGK